MNEEKWKRFMKNEMEKEMQEIDAILEEMNQDPEMRDMVAPEEIHDKLFATIHKGQDEQERLSEDEKELIRLGMVYKKTRKWAKVLVPLVAVVGAMVISVTCMGGPKRAMEKFGRLIGDREQEYMNTDDDRTDEIDVVTEAEAYEKIEDEFGFLPVKLYYLPEGIEFDEMQMLDNAQNIYIAYEGKKQESIIYSIYPSYRTSSIGRDVEDEVFDEYEKVVHDITIYIKKYFVEENQSNRYKASFEYQNVYYFLEINNVESQEVDEIIENLYFN